MFNHRLGPNRIKTTGDDTPVASALHYAWRMGGKHQIGISVLALLVAVLTMIPLELQRRIINNAIEQQEIPLLITLGAMYLLIVLLQTVAKFLMRMYQGWLSESATLYTRAHLFRLRGRKALRGSDDGEGRAVSIIGAEVDRLGGFVGEGISQPVVNLGILLAIIGYMMVVDPLVALFSLMFLVPQIVLVPLLQRQINRLIEQRLSLLRSLSDTIASESDGGQIDGASDLEPQLDGIYSNRIRTFLLKFALKAASNALSALAPLTVLLVGGYFVIEGDTSIGVVVAFISGFERLASPLRELLAYYRIAAQANVQHDMIARWM